jgi:hypothetical protein
MRSNVDSKLRPGAISSKRTFQAACLVLAGVVLNGCASMQVHLGMKVYLDRTPVQSMKISLVNASAIGPGQKIPLVVVFTQPNGKILQTEGAGHGKVMWKDLQVTASIVTANQKGVISLPRDPRVSDGKVPHVSVTAPSHPDLRADLDIPIRYDEKYVANFSGVSGTSGLNGADGLNGISGTSGSIDPNNPSPGGNGSDGTDGSNGQDGGAGGDAPPVQVRIAFRPGSHPLLQIGVSARGQQKFYLLDPQGGSLTVKADGGAGGSGGRGGRGGQGGSGGIGTPNGQSGRNGSDGRNGLDGSPGRGGKITVAYDPQAKPYLAAIHLSSEYGPAPTFQEESVSPLW